MFPKVGKKEAGLGCRRDERSLQGSRVDASAVAVLLKERQGKQRAPGLRLNSLSQVLL